MLWLTKLIIKIGCMKLCMDDVGMLRLDLMCFAWYMRLILG